MRSAALLLLAVAVVALIVARRRDPVPATLWPRFDCDCYCHEASEFGWPGKCGDCCDPDYEDVQPADDYPRRVLARGAA